MEFKIVFAVNAVGRNVGRFLFPLGEIHEDLGYKYPQVGIARRWNLRLLCIPNWIIMHLSELKTGESAIIIKVLGHGGFRRRILEMGFVRGQKVTSILNAPLKDPIKYRIMEYEVSLRRSEAQMIEIEPYTIPSTLPNSSSIKENGTNGVDLQEESSRIEEIVSKRSKEINVALVGNPNSGKTSLFNALSGEHEHVGNYSGVTVDAKIGHFTYGGYKFNITDLPGTYALTAYSPEEIYVRKYLIEHAPDVILNSVVSSNLERNLYLTTELIDINQKSVVALNMYDELERSGAELDYTSLGKLVGIPMVPVVAKEHKGLDVLIQAIIDVYEGGAAEKQPVNKLSGKRVDTASIVRHIHIKYSPAIEREIASISKEIKAAEDVFPNIFPTRYWTVKLLEGDKEVERLLQQTPYYEKFSAMRSAAVERIRKQLDEDVESAVTDEKYGFISGALRETYTPGSDELKKNTALIDSVVTNKLFGFPLFLLLMWIMFNATFTLGAYPQEWIESLVAFISNAVNGAMSDGVLKDLIVNGIIGGVGGVIVFLPNILILYLFISMMEDSGYMARAAFIMDKLMHKMGLHGKSFIPLIMGFGCNVPAIMSARTIESPSSKIITILITPFMSCSARLPVFILFAGIFFPEHSGSVLMLLYLFGILIAILTAKMLRKFLFREDDTPFVMELPPYRIPTLNATLQHMWEKCAQYLRKIGSVILFASVIIWFLGYYPRPENSIGTSQSQNSTVSSITTESIPFQTAPDAVAKEVADVDTTTLEVADVNTTTLKVANVDTTTLKVANVDATTLEVADVDATTLEVADGAVYNGSYLECVGKFCEPVLEPLGLNWKAGVALISGASAKEIIVSTLGVLYADGGQISSHDEAVYAKASSEINGHDVTASAKASNEINDHDITASAKASSEINGHDVTASAKANNEINGHDVTAYAKASGEINGHDVTAYAKASDDVNSHDEDALLKKQLIRSGDFTTASAIAFMVFALLYFPCLATLAAIANETGSWKWALFSFIYSCTLAWVLAFIAYNIWNLFA